MYWWTSDQLLILMVWVLTLFIPSQIIHIYCTIQSMNCALQGRRQLHVEVGRLRSYRGWYDNIFWAFAFGGECGSSKKYFITYKCCRLILNIEHHVPLEVNVPAVNQDGRLHCRSQQANSHLFFQGYYFRNNAYFFLWQFSNDNIFFPLTV